MAFATNNALISYSPEAFDQGVDDWTDDLNRAEQDVRDMVQAKWYNNHRNPKDYSKPKLTESNGKKLRYIEH